MKNSSLTTSEQEVLTAMENTPTAALKSKLIKTAKTPGLVENDTIAALGVKSPYLEKFQKIHSFAILLIPIPLSIYAFMKAANQGIHMYEIGLFFLMYCVSWIGITVGYHRFYSHRSFEGNKFVKIMLAIFGSMACQGPLNYWVSNHRRHHHYSDRPGDIHSPYIDGEKPIKGWFKSFWHSHVAWTYKHEITNTGVVAKDIMKDPLFQKLNSTYYLWLALGFIVPGIIGGIITLSVEGFIQGVLWGGFVRLLFTYHTTNTITSLTHMWGKKEFKSQDESRNNFWLALPTWGEAWHNNHHAFPFSAIFGLKWYQFDLGGIFIRTLEFLGMAWNVKVPSQKIMDSKKI